MSSELFAQLVQATLLASAAVAVAWLLRSPVRRSLGARAAYALWLLVPAAVVASLLPGSEQAAATFAPPVGAVIAASVATLSPAPSSALASLAGGLGSRRTWDARAADGPADRLPPPAAPGRRRRIRSRGPCRPGRDRPAEAAPGAALRFRTALHA
ncbi:M56 family metallopeptidase [Arenimonas daejeonensis]|uniref:M56 family metallopeptidase n=1 Tax=Arenimonas daejeonensis TaxID=370777 RepID=UPI0011BE482F